jgi:hypothetical protein
MEKIFGVSLQQTKDHISLIRADTLYHHSDLNDCKDEVSKIMNDIIMRNPSNPIALHVPYFPYLTFRNLVFF